MGTEIDLDAILAIVDGYDARMKIVREYFDRREPVPEEYKQYLAPLEDEDVVKAFEALRPLVARVRELERQREFLIDHFADNGLCFMPLDFCCSERSKSGCSCYAEKYIKESCVLCRAEEAAKEEHHDG